jgi:hypothetical protein
MSTSPHSITPEIAKRIAYNPETKDFDCFIAIDEGPEQYIGSAPTHPQAECTCRDYAYQFYSDTYTPEKAAPFALMDDAPPAIPREGPSVVAEAPTRHAMYLDGALVGFARTTSEARTTLDELIAHIHWLDRVASADREAETTFDQLVAEPHFIGFLPSAALPVPPSAQVAEALGVLAAYADGPGIFAEAIAHLAGGVSLTADGVEHRIDGVRVYAAPHEESWPWRCACGAARCWHGALLAGVRLAWERLGADPRPLPFEVVT